MKKIHLLPLWFLLFLTNCAKEAEPGIVPVISGLEQGYLLTTNQMLELKPTVGNAPSATYTWILNGVEDAATPTYTFTAPSVEGRHTLVLRITTAGGVAQKAIVIEVGNFTVVTGTPNTLLTPELPDNLKGKANYKWEIVNASSRLFRLSYAETETPLFIAAKTGEYALKVTADGLVQKYLVKLRNDMSSQTAYISQVFDYLPAPGQFVNKLPKYDEGDTHADMVAKTGTNLVGGSPTMITLGGWGGYVVFGFDHTITNVKGKRDFRILGNAFGANANPRPDAPFGGSCEPGIIMVGYDKNKNGKPDDDEWYEIKGSGNFSAENEPWYPMAVDNKNDLRTFRDYEMTYYKPSGETPEETGEINNPGSFVTIRNYIKWTDNKGQQGYKVKNVYHKQTYYPAWIQDGQVTYKGIRLADNGIDESGQGSYYVLYAYKWGYVDNFPNNDDRSGIDIDWAIDKDGNPADLPGIDFVKVYNGVDKENGWLGEASTEVAGAHDLHMLEKSIETIEIN